MKDHFKEEVVIRRNATIFNLFYIVAWIIVVIIGVYAVFMLQMLMLRPSVLALLMFLGFAGAAVLLYFAKDELKVEYEYAFTNGTLDFAKVLRASRRKELGSMNVANVNACGHVAHQSFQRFISMQGIEKKNWFLNRDGNLFYFYYEKEARKHIIVIEPSEAMVEMIRLYLPAGVYQG